MRNNNLTYNQMSSPYSTTSIYNAINSITNSNQGVGGIFTILVQSGTIVINTFTGTSATPTNTLTQVSVGN